MAKKSVTYDEDAPELTEAELAEFRPARHVMSPEQFEAAVSVRRGRPKARNPKVPVTIRLDRDVVEALRASGTGWQTRANAILAKAVARGET